jgi:phage regulator Rha-like protein
MSRELVPNDSIEDAIYEVRGRKVMLDSDLADLYGVETRRLNEQVKRNTDRFPEDFVFQLTEEEWENLRSQIATSSSGHGGRRYPPFAFTEHGAVMLASVLNTPVAVKASIQVVRAFNRMRHFLSLQHELAEKLDRLEDLVGEHDEKISLIFQAIRELMQPEEDEDKKRIGF